MAMGEHRTSPGLLTQRQAREPILARLRPETIEARASTPIGPGKAQVDRRGGDNRRVAGRRAHRRKRLIVARGAERNRLVGSTFKTLERLRV